MFIASRVPDADRMRPGSATNPARTDERQRAIRTKGQKKRFGGLESRLRTHDAARRHHPLLIFEGRADS